MKIKTRATLSIIAVSAAFVSLVSCRKDVPEGKLIIAEGTITNYTSQSPLAGAKVYLYGGRFSMYYGISYAYGPYDSAVSDASGHFSLHYHAEGNSKDYAVTLHNAGIDNNSSVTAKDPWEPYQVPLNYAYRLSDIRFTVYKTSPLQIRLSVADIAHDSLLVEVQSGTFSANFFFLYGKPSADTVLHARFVPRMPLFIQYYSFGNDTVINGISYRRELTDTLQLNSSDSVQIEKRIGSTSDFPLHSY